MEWFREPRGPQPGGTHPRIGHSSSLDQNDPLHELDSGYSDTCGGMLSVHHFQYPGFRAVENVPLLPVVPVRTPKARAGISIGIQPVRRIRAPLKWVPHSERNSRGCIVQKHPITVLTVWVF